MVNFLKGFPLLVLAGCYEMPGGPTVTALRGDAKSPDEFRTNDRDCRQYAFAQTNVVASGSADHAVRVTGSVHGTAVSTAADAAVDGRDPTAASGRPGSVIGGIDSAQFAGYGLQQHYNRAYVECMYLKGNNVTLLARERWPAPRSPWPPDPDAYYSPVQRRVR